MSLGFSRLSGVAALPAFHSRREDEERASEVMQKNEQIIGVTQMEADEVIERVNTFVNEITGTSY